jgi:hypothetical protein
MPGEPPPRNPELHQDPAASFPLNCNDKHHYIRGYKRSRNGDLDDRIPTLDP